MNQNVSLINVVNLWIWDFVSTRGDVYVSFPSNYKRGEEYSTIFLSHVDFIVKFRITILEDRIKMFWVYPSDVGLLMPKKVDNDEALCAVSPHFFNRISHEVDEWIKTCRPSNVQSAN